MIETLATWYGVTGPITLLGLLAWWEVFGDDGGIIQTAAIIYVLPIVAVLWTVAKTIEATINCFLCLTRSSYRVEIP